MECKEITWQDIVDAGCTLQKPAPFTIERRYIQADLQRFSSIDHFYVVEDDRGELCHVCATLKDAVEWSKDHIQIGDTVYKRPPIGKSE